MTDFSLPRRRGKVPRIPVELTEDEWAQLDAHVNDAITCLRRSGAFWELRKAACFRALQDRAGRMTIAQYGAIIAQVAGYPGYDDLDGRFVPVPPAEPALADFYARAVNLALESAGLYNAQRPEENHQYRVLVAHLFVCPSPIERAADLPDVFYPLPLKLIAFLHNSRLDDDARTWVLAEPAARNQDLRRLVAKVQAAYDPLAERLPYGRISEEKEKEKTTRQPRRRRTRMSAQRRKLAEVVVELLEEEPLDGEPRRNYDDVLDNDRFKQARDRAAGAPGTRIGSVSALSELMKQHSDETGWAHPRRRRS